jgi:hypothetical protein
MFVEKVLIREVRHPATLAGNDYRNQAFAGRLQLQIRFDQRCPRPTAAQSPAIPAE